ncbi:Glycosyltransferase involved in cell wall bisynthesis [Nitrosospira multiformis]|uniref:Glycosyltransferase involved in cell wall bisynthesis n=1 Tax=Nitrosospira multiformis TaxID=1231 RepID=A0A1H9YHC3_9PROT|nr:glycosyltransferase family 4 protein [Nitrosospira multiformis]SES68444.1 Glycosyltransferase involved in cell wall bisynthesis [Nitrosospira multiformis]
MKIISTAERPINLLEIIGASIVGGMETYVLRLLERLPQDTFRVTCLCVAEGKLTSQLRDIGCSVHITPITDEPDWQSILLGASLIRADAIDVIHAHLPNAHSLAGILSRLTDTPAIATIHGRYLSMRDFEVHKLMNTHISVVAKTAYFQALTLGVTSTKLRFIPNGIDTKIFYPAPKSNYLHSLIKIPPEAPLVGFIGRLSPEKGPEMFVRMAQLAHKRLKNCHFVLVGEGPMRRELQNEIDEHDLTDHIHMAGLQRDMTKIYPCLDLVVSTSYSEAMPLVIVEAMASGLPVVATNVGGVVDIVEVGGTGLLKKPGDTEGLANDVVTLMTSNSIRIRMGEAARKRVEEKFDLNDIVAQTAQLLRSLPQSGIKGSDADTAKGYRKARS